MTGRRIGWILIRWWWLIDRVFDIAPRHKMGVGLGLNYTALRITLEYLGDDIPPSRSGYTPEPGLVSKGQCISGCY